MTGDNISNERSGGHGGMHRPGMRRPGGSFPQRPEAPVPSNASTVVPQPDLQDQYQQPVVQRPAPAAPQPPYLQAQPDGYLQSPMDGMAMQAPGALMQDPVASAPQAQVGYGYGGAADYGGQQDWRQPAPQQPVQQPVASPYLATQPQMQGYNQPAAPDGGLQSFPSQSPQTVGADAIDPLGGSSDYAGYSAYATPQDYQTPAASAQQYGSSTQAGSAPTQNELAGYDVGDQIDPTEDKGILGAAADDDSKIAAVEEKAVENIEKRDLRDVRDVRRGRKSKLQPNAAVDARKQAKTVRMFTIGLIVVLLGIAVFNVLIPKKQWSADEIQSISKVANGDTGFPVQEGSGVATQFMKAYLEAGTDEIASNQMLQAFYNGQTYADVAEEGGTAAGNPSNMQTPSDVVTKIQSGPYVYESRPVSADGKSGTYKLGALIYRQNAANGQPVMTADGKNIAYKWVFYQVDLFYDSKTNKFSVSKNSPVRVTEPGTAAAAAAPEYELPGDGKEIDEMENDDMQKLVTQFFTSWGASDQTALSVMINKKQSKPSVTQGLNGTVTLAGDPSYKIYGPPASDRYYRALVTVTWKETVTPEASYTQTSTYVLKLEKDGNKFYVIDVQPYLYIPQQKKSDSTSSSSEDDSSSESNSSK